jgi:hypothetical protein
MPEAEQSVFLAGRLSQAAGSMLQKDWSHDPLPSKRAIAKQDAQSGWKGRNAAMAALLKYYISFDEDPLKLLLNLVDLLLESCLPHAQFAGRWMPLPSSLLMDLQGFVLL